MIFIRLMMVGVGLFVGGMWYLLLTKGIPEAAQNEVIGTLEVVGLWVFAIFSIVATVAVFVYGWKVWAKGV